MSDFTRRMRTGLHDSMPVLVTSVHRADVEEELGVDRPVKKSESWLERDGDTINEGAVDRWVVELEREHGDDVVVESI
jgi:hypothetical protein